MNDISPQTVYLKDYTPVPYLVEEVYLDFSLAPEATQVASRLKFRPNPKAHAANAPLVLDGEKLALISISRKPRGVTALG